MGAGLLTPNRGCLQPGEISGLIFSAVLVTLRAIVPGGRLEGGAQPASTPALVFSGRTPWSHLPLGPRLPTYRALSLDYPQSGDPLPGPISPDGPARPLDSLSSDIVGLIEGGLETEPLHDNLPARL